MSSVSEALQNCLQRTDHTSLDIPVLLVHWDRKNPYYSLSREDQRTPTKGLIRLHGQLICVLAIDRLVVGFTQGSVATSLSHTFLSVAGIDHDEHITVHIAIPFEAFNPIDNLWIQLKRWIRPDLTDESPYPSAPSHNVYVPRSEHLIHLQITEVQFHFHHYIGPHSSPSILLSTVFAVLCIRYDSGPSSTGQELPFWQEMIHGSGHKFVESERTLNDCYSDIVFSPIFRPQGGVLEDVTDDGDTVEEEDIADR